MPLQRPEELSEFHVAHVHRCTYLQKDMPLSSICCTCVSYKKDYSHSPPEALEPFAPYRELVVVAAVVVEKTHHRESWQAAEDIVDPWDIVAWPVQIETPAQDTASSRARTDVGQISLPGATVIITIHVRHDVYSANVLQTIVT